MKQHSDLMRDILDHGDVKGDRTGTGTISLFGGMMKFSLQHGFWPIPTTREIDHEKISSELEWMLRGIVSVSWLKDRGNGIWNAWMGPETGTIGPMYGEQWRNFNAGMTLEDWEGHEIRNLLAKKQTYTASELHELVGTMMRDKKKLYQDGGRGGVDQLAYIVNELKNNPDSRRMCVSVWHAGLLPDLEYSPKENADRGKMALAPCHSMWQVGSADLTDMEILREIAYRDEEYSPEVESVIRHNRHMDCIGLTKQLKMLSNVWMARQGWTQSKYTMPLSWQELDKPPMWPPVDYVADTSYEITALGRDMIEKYKAVGKPLRKLFLLCFARSQDVPLGTVFNVGMYSKLAHLLAKLGNMVPWEYTHLMGDHHIYSNQIPFVEQQLARNQMSPARIIIDPSIRSIEDFNYKNTTVFYEAHEKIVYPRAAV